MINTVFSLLPPILTIVCVLLTKKVIPSIGIGIVSAALLLYNFNIIEAGISIVTTFFQMFYNDGLQIGNIQLLAFLFLLGVLTSLINKMGGTRAFAQYAKKYVKDRKGAELLAFILGIIIFIDDYFNALTVGEIARPLCDEHNSSREKLSYIIDSTSAPVCVVFPLSSWGAYILSLLVSLLAIYSIDEAPLTAFLKSIPYNLYAVFSLVMVVAVILFEVKIGKMPMTSNLEKEEEVTHVTTRGKAADLLEPILLLILVSFGGIFLTGYLNGGSADIMSILENTDTYLSLFSGAAVSVTWASYRFFKFSHTGYIDAWKSGLKAMVDAVLILLFAWTLIEFVSAIGTGTYLSNLFTSINLSPALLPVTLFIISALMSLSTGTSWGTFGIMIPIGTQMAMNLDPSVLYMCLGAVLSGSVFGDHCSPISDTTILSSAGAKCNHIDHVTTQLPYAMFVAITSSIAYLIAAATNTVFAYVFMIICFVAIIFLKGNVKNKA